MRRGSIVAGEKPAHHGDERKVYRYEQEFKGIEIAGRKQAGESEETL